MVPPAKPLPAKVTAFVAYLREHAARLLSGWSHSARARSLIFTNQSRTTEERGCAPVGGTRSPNHVKWPMLVFMRAVQMADATAGSRARDKCPTVLALLVVLPAFVGSSACGGKHDDQAQPDGSVAVLSVGTPAGDVPPCPLEYEHPNICCTGGVDASTACTESQNTPFARCSNTALTFPDPQLCCPLAGGSACLPPLDAGARSSCSYPCGPGAWLQPPSDGGAELSPCTDVPNMAVDGGGLVPTDLCSYCCAGGGCATDMGGCSPNGPCGEPVTFGCDVCPDSFHNVAGIPDLCCSADGGPTDTCFSQAGHIANRPL
jgi:hypothetical protein